MSIGNVTGRVLAALLALGWLCLALLVILGAGVHVRQLLLAVLPLAAAGLCLLAAVRRPSGIIGPAAQLLVGLPALVLLIGLGAMLVGAAAEAALDDRPADRLAAAQTVYALLVGLALSSLYAGLLLGGRRKAAVLAAGVSGLATVVVGLVALFVPPAIAVPPGCIAPQPVTLAAIEIRASAEVDGRLLASGRLGGVRDATGEQWQATRSGSHVPASSAELVWLEQRTWLLEDGGQWQAVAAPTATDTLDGPLLALLAAGQLSAAEDLGAELVEGQPARRCRLLVEGTTAGEVVPLLGWLLGEPILAGRTNLPIWRGELDWWTGTDGRLLRAELFVGGHPSDAWGLFGLQGRLGAELAITELAAPPDIREPLP